MNVTFTKLDGTALAVDPNNVTAVVAMTAAQCALAGITTGQGTNLTVSGVIQPVMGSVPDVLALLNGASLGPAVMNVATRTALAAIAAADRSNGQTAIVRSDGSRWIFDAASALAADVAAPDAVTAAALVLVPTAGTGRWLRTDNYVMIRLPFISTDVTGVKWTCPAGFAAKLVGMPFWDVLSSVAGDGARRVCWSSSNMGSATTAGDLLGPVGGMTQGGLAVAQQNGTIGVDFSAADTANTSLAVLNGMLWRAGETIRQDVPAAGTDTITGMTCWPMAIERGAGTLIS